MTERGLIGDDALHALLAPHTVGSCSHLSGEAVNTYEVLHDLGELAARNGTPMVQAVAAVLDGYSSAEADRSAADDA
jgi:hypothetical protein